MTPSFSLFPILCSKASNIISHIDGGSFIFSVTALLFGSTFLYSGNLLGTDETWYEEIRQQKGREIFNVKLHVLPNNLYMNLESINYTLSAHLRIEWLIYE
jgi:hypothetical protein